MQKWFDATADLVGVGDNVREYDSALECYIELEVLKVCPKTFLVEKYDKHRATYYFTYIPHHKLGIVPKEVTTSPDIPEVLRNISIVWERLAEQSQATGYFTHRAGFYFVYHSKLWFLGAPGYQEGHYLPHVDIIHQFLQEEGATCIDFDEGELD